MYIQSITFRVTKICIFFFYHRDNIPFNMYLKEKLRCMMLLRLREHEQRKSKIRVYNRRIMNEFANSSTINRSMIFCERLVIYTSRSETLSIMKLCVEIAVLIRILWLPIIIDNTITISQKRKGNANYRELSTSTELYIY